MKVTACLIQDSPVFFDKSKTLQKVESLTRKHAREGCDLIVFPESFIPGYPRGFTFGAKVGSRDAEGRKLFGEYHRNSLDLESADLKRLENLAREEQVYLVIGVTEKQHQNGSLYCSMLYLSPTDGLLGVHRKIKPTGTERLIWAEADGSSLVTFQTKIGKLGGLICWENYMPLARMSMYRKGVEIYVAPTADSRAGWTATLQHIALEGRCFVLGCNQYYTKSMYPPQYKSLVQGEPENLCPGGSAIVSPMGEFLAGPLYDKAGALRAELDLETIIPSKMDFDVNGHYSREDIFQLRIKGQPETGLEETRPDPEV
ncbi:carbon-nitrogen hydrolase family protein [Robiginitalea sp.]|uniref:carbon-nitrogen hydrolase family protein n=3 Tax=Robiginitalea sp. TaxID=1902411 RepID=UPI003C71AD78